MKKLVAGSSLKCLMALTRSSPDTLPWIETLLCPLDSSISLMAVISLWKWAKIRVFWIGEALMSSSSIFSLVDVPS
ncbi:hypothetical protein FR483_n279R [Paramecium bursaria Chlorella virus FR483]|uniref:Uncharacterized protein n279R n=1 Tax=Paramecium bursaria Chlorella virus FR483 TaxID=399781 RepID=A7J6Y3_PBCVF|nr:hypothetical protein FR483_n279R [Paramecium bursaria Chlorella virus FR483]ABT15564.1 hypothetical protein FR483_n279R [Paramecium bursaria Chlorella virus FR483]